MISLLAVDGPAARAVRAGGGLLPRPQQPGLRAAKRSLLLRVGRRQPRRSLPHPDAPAPGAGLGLGRARVRDRARPGAALPPAPLARARRSRALTGVLYTVPSIAFFVLLLPITGRGTDTAIIALTAYTLQIIYRNIVAGLANVPAEAKDSGRGMGMTQRQLLWRVELPLAVPEIIAGLRIATVSTVAIATLAVFAGAGGLGAEIYGRTSPSRPGSSSAAASRS